MILLDADILINDLMYPNDANINENTVFLKWIAAAGVERGITTQGLLEVVGKRSPNIPLAAIPKMPAALCAFYGLKIVPDTAIVPDYAGCTYDEVLAQIGLKMSLGDAVMAIQVARFAPNADVLITWNAKHFIGKLAIPVLTPTQWLAQQTPAGPVP